MIYLKNITDSQVLFVPKNGIEAAGALSLQLKSTIDHVVTLDAVVDLGTSGLYYNLAVTLPSDIDEGEYEYTLLDGDTELSTGLLVIGEGATPTEYENSIQYEQYN